jgi:hypothetical protein
MGFYNKRSKFRIQEYSSTGSSINKILKLGVADFQLGIQLLHRKSVLSRVSIDFGPYRED